LSVCDMLPPLKECGLPASANTRWILRQAFNRLCPSLFRICANPARLYVSAGVRRSSLHDQLPTGLRLATVKRKRDLSVTLAFIPPLKGVGIPARNHAKRGFSVLLVEKRQFGRYKCCAGAVPRELLERYTLPLCHRTQLKRSPFSIPRT